MSTQSIQEQDLCKSQDMNCSTILSEKTRRLMRISQIRQELISWMEQNKSTPKGLRTPAAKTEKMRIKRCLQTS